MKHKKIYAVFSLIVVMGLILAACAPASPAPTEAPAVTEEAPAATEAPVATEAPMASTDRKGGWLDEIVFSVISSDSAVSQLQAEAIDFYSFNLSSCRISRMQV